MIITYRPNKDLMKTNMGVVVIYYKSFLVMKYVTSLIFGTLIRSLNLYHSHEGRDQFNAVV